MTLKSISLLTIGIFAAVLFVMVSLTSSNDPIRSAVKITNYRMNSGGTGVILSSTHEGSLILTNGHVCGLLAGTTGGFVHTKDNFYFVTEYKKSELHDLCLIKVSSNLGVNTKVATSAPFPYYENASVSGHPHLFPNVVTKGHYSGFQTIPILTGVRPCTKAEESDPGSFWFCLGMGGMPIVKLFESQLVTALIMPGSSGSGVYNSSDELTNLVFAGQNDLGYAWTIPHAYVVRFLNEEAPKLQFTKSSGTQELNSNDLQRRFTEFCANPMNNTVKSFCHKMTNDLIYREE